MEVDGRATGSAAEGILVYLGVAKGDTREDAAWLADKAANLRIFEDETGTMNRSVVEEGGPPTRTPPPPRSRRSSTKPSSPC